jgi:hypothetical protein
MIDFALAILFILFLAFGIMLGMNLGEGWGQGCVTKHDYLIANLKIYGIGVAGIAICMMLTVYVVTGVPFGIIAGGMAGCKMGFGESVGPWKFVDKTFKVNKDHLRRSKNGNAEAVRRARKEGTPEPEFMSVAGSDTSDEEKNPKGRK